MLIRRVSALGAGLRIYTPTFVGFTFEGTMTMLNRCLFVLGMALFFLSSVVHAQEVEFEFDRSQLVACTGPMPAEAREALASGAVLWTVDHAARNRVIPEFRGATTAQVQRFFIGPEAGKSYNEKEREWLTLARKGMESSLTHLVYTPEGTVLTTNPPPPPPTDYARFIEAAAPDRVTVEVLPCYRVIHGMTYGSRSRDPATGQLVQGVEASSKDFVIAFSEKGVSTPDGKPGIKGFLTAPVEPSEGPYVGQKVQVLVINICGNLTILHFIVESPPVNVVAEKGKLQIFKEYIPSRPSDNRFARWTIYNERKETVLTLAEDQNGKSPLADLPTGRYEAVESAMEGYVAERQSLSFEVKANEVTNVRFVNRHQPAPPPKIVKGTLKVVKSYEGTRPEGYREEWVVYDSRNEVAGKLRADGNGMVPILELPSGRYTVVEKKMKGFNPRQERITVEVKDGEEALAEFVNVPIAAAITSASGRKFPWKPLLIGAGAGLVACWAIHEINKHREQEEAERIAKQGGPGQRPTSGLVVTVKRDRVFVGMALVVGR